MDRIYADMISRPSLSLKKPIRFQIQETLQNEDNKLSLKSYINKIDSALSRKRLIQGMKELEKVNTKELSTNAFKIQKCEGVFIYKKENKYCKTQITTEEEADKHVSAFICTLCRVHYTNLKPHKAICVGSKRCISCYIELRNTSIKTHVKHLNSKECEESPKKSSPNKRKLNKDAFMVAVDDRRKKHIKVRKVKKSLQLNETRSQKRKCEDKVENTRKQSKNDDTDSSLLPTIVIPKRMGFKTREKFPCSQCEHVANSKSYLEDHVLYVHENKTPFKCNHCDYETAFEMNLTRHIKF